MSGAIIFRIIAIMSSPRGPIDVALGVGLVSYRAAPRAARR